jgi:hypothetical protein
MVAEIPNRSVRANGSHHRKGKKMATTTVPVALKKIAKKRVFDLEKFEKKTVEKEYEVPSPLTSVDDVLGLDGVKLLAYVNSGREREAWKEARNSIEGISPKVVNQTVNTFRLYMFPDLVEMVNGEQTADSRKKHTQAIYSFIRSTPQIIDSLREAQKRAAASNEDDDDDEGAGE